MNRELTQYFERTNTEYLDYIISQDGIQLIINEKETMYGWEVIDRVKSDGKYFYFSSSGRHSLISKESLSLENIDTIDKWMKSMNQKK
ncbi:MAG: YcxB family protein [Ruminococcus sp.]|nr:YcxB family protein [Ruminococcus sp.]